jgi:hypothetical protein
MSESQFFWAWAIVSAIIIIPVFVYIVANDYFVFIPLVVLPLILFALLLLWLLGGFVWLGFATKEQGDKGGERLGKYYTRVRAQATGNFKRSLERSLGPLARRTVGVARRAVVRGARGGARGDGDAYALVAAER